MLHGRDPRSHEGEKDMTRLAHDCASRDEITALQCEIKLSADIIALLVAEKILTALRCYISSQQQRDDQDTCNEHAQLSRGTRFFQNQFGSEYGGPRHRK